MVDRLRKFFDGNCLKWPEKYLIFFEVGNLNF